MKKNMNRKKWKQFSTLRATPEMMATAAEDKPQITRIKYVYSMYEEKKYQYGLYMRCQLQKEILTVAFYLPENMKTGGDLPVYELFIQKSTEQFITYDRMKNKWRTAKLDRLSWPDYVNHSKEKWICRKELDIIQEYLGTQESAYDGILAYQLKIRAKELERRHKKETDPWDQDLKQTPALPKDWQKWADKVGIQENYIFYQYSRKGAVSGYCTYCEREVPIKHPRHNKEGRCQRCRHTITYKAYGKTGRLQTKRNYMYLLQRCKDGFMLREFTGERWYARGEYLSPRLYVDEYRRVICGVNGVMLRAYYWGDYKLRGCRWIETELSRLYWSRDYAGPVYGKTLPDLSRRELNQTGLREAVLGLKTIDPERYFVALRRVPSLEQFVKAGLFTLAKECISKLCFLENEPEFVKAGRLIKRLGIDTQRLKRLRKQNGGQAFLAWLQYEKQKGCNLPDSLISWFCKENISAEKLSFISDRMSMLQIYNYMRRQMKENGMDSKEMLTVWKDYLSMAKRFHMDTGDSIIFRAAKLKKRHDELVGRCQQKGLVLQAAEILEKYPQIEEIYQSVKEMYSYAGKEYTVLVPERIEDILLEGQNLQHCVGSSDRYWERVERKESYILFLRRTAEPECSYYTLEVEPDGTVRQKRTLYDRQGADIKKVEDFLRKWQKTVARRLTQKERELAKESRQLRKEEFVKLREKQTIVHAGDLQGKRLLDVLMSDLMENSEAEKMPETTPAA